MRSTISALARTLGTLADLFLPKDCAGCGLAADVLSSSICPSCTVALPGMPGPTRPSPAPAGLPPCIAGGEYDGSLRELILSYKERGRRGLAAPLGDTLATVVAAGLPSAGSTAVVLVPVPATAAAARARWGDHMLRLARRAGERLRDLGHHAVIVPALQARPRADSVHLDRHQRALTARDAFRVRPPRVRWLRAAVGAGARGGAGRRRPDHRLDARGRGRSPGRGWDRRVVRRDAGGDQTSPGL